MRQQSAPSPQQLVGESGPGEEEKIREESIMI
jgi:hypothetical protein